MSFPFQSSGNQQSTAPGGFKFEAATGSSTSSSTAPVYTFGQSSNKPATGAFGSSFLPQNTPAINTNTSGISNPLGFSFNTPSSSTSALTTNIGAPSGTPSSSTIPAFSSTAPYTFGSAQTQKPPASSSTTGFSFPFNSSNAGMTSNPSVSSTTSGVPASGSGIGFSFPSNTSSAGTFSSTSTGSGTGTGFSFPSSNTVSTPTTTSSNTSSVPSSGVAFSFNAPSGSTSSTTLAPSSTTGFGTTAGVSTTTSSAIPSSTPSAGLASTTPSSTTVPSSGFTFNIAPTNPASTNMPTLGTTGVSFSNATKPAGPGASSILNAPLTKETPFAFASGSTTTSVSQPITSNISISATLKNRSLDEILQFWEKELEEQLKAFHNQANEISIWDRKLIESGEKILSLHEQVLKHEALQLELSQNLAYIEGQQVDLQKLLDQLEADTQILSENNIQMQRTDEERAKAYEMAEKLNQQLDDVGRNVAQMVRQINESHEQSNDPNNPLFQISKILNTHLTSLQWIDETSENLQRKLDEAVRAGKIALQDQQRMMSGRESVIS